MHTTFTVYAPNFETNFNYDTAATCLRIEKTIALSAVSVESIIAVDRAAVIHQHPHHGYLRINQ
jgi:hypothetical protein